MSIEVLTTMANSPDLDRLIANVARAMTAGEPSSDLAARVRERLGERSQRQWLWTLVPFTAAAVAIAVVMSTRPASVPPIAAAITTAKVATAVEPSRIATEPTGSVVVAAISSRAPKAAPSPDEMAWQERAIPALTSPDALAIDSIQPKALSIRPLETKPLSVPALDVDDGRH